MTLPTPQTTLTPECGPHCATNQGATGHCPVCHSTADKPSERMIHERAQEVKH